MKPGTRVLLVEDDRSISRLLQLELEHRGLTVACAFDGPTAISAVETFAPHAIVLDILLPGFDGEQVLRRLRERGTTTPIVMLTARDKPRDKVRNLDYGADDYLTKPFDIEELLARLRAVLRRIEADEVLRVGDLVINTFSRQVRRGTRQIELTGREYDLVEFLARNARRVLSRDVLLDRVWHQTPDADPNVVDVYVGYLRKKLDVPGAPKLIQTVRGVGFARREEGRCRSDGG